MRQGRLLVSAIIIAAVGFFILSRVYRIQIGERVFARAAQTAVTRDVMGNLPDGLHVVLLGSGSPFGDPSRAGPSTAIIAGDRLFIVDAGSGSPRNFGAVGLRPGAIERVFLTHFHSDHIDSLGELMLQRWAGGAKTEPLPIHGPSGVEQVVEGFNLAYGLDKGYRIAHHGEDVVPEAGFGGIAEPFSIEEPTVLLDYDNLRVTAFPVEHDPVHPAVGYRFDYKDRSVTLTGDTGSFQGLVTQAQDSDLLVAEALNPDMVAVIKEELAAEEINNLVKIMSDIPDYHMTPVDAAETAQAANVRMLVLNHIVPALPTPYLDAYFTKRANQHYSRKIIVGRDGMLFSLPAGKKKIVRKSLN